MALNENENLYGSYTGASIGSTCAARTLGDIAGAYSRVHGPQPPPPSQSVPEALGALEKQLCVALDRMGEMMERLGPVLRPEPPSVGTDKPASVARHSPLAEHIDTAARLAGEITDMIQRIFGRLDI